MWCGGWPRLRGRLGGQVLAVTERLERRLGLEGPAVLLGEKGAVLCRLFAIGACRPAGTGSLGVFRSAFAWFETALYNRNGGGAMPLLAVM